MIDFDQLEQDLRATRVEMDPAKKAELGERLRERQAPAPVRAGRSWRRLLTPVAGVAAAAAIAFVVVIGQDGEDDAGSGSVAQLTAPEAETPARSGGAAADRAAPTEPDASVASPGAAGSATLAAPAPDPAPTAPPGGRRYIERDTSLSLTTELGELREVANGIVRETKEAGGIVDTSSVSVGETGGSASFALRVPADRLAGAVRSLSALGDVAALDESTQDITGSVASASERLSEARAERRGILRGLQRADSERELRALRRRLAEVRSRISRADGDLRAARRSANWARVQVEVTATGEEREDGAGAGWTPGDAAGDAWRILGWVAGAALVAAAVLVPLLLVVAVVAGGGRLARRRRREHALDTV